MDTRELLALIIARCPDLAHQATGALRAHQTNSQIAQRRIIAVVSDAVRLYDDWTEDERAALIEVARLAAGGKPQRTLNLIVRASADEKARVQALADEAGQSVSDYIRQRIGLG